MTDYKRRLNTPDYMAGPTLETRSCNCVGPQDGLPRCPCMMRGVTVKDGRYVQVVDLGPAYPEMRENDE